MNSLMTVFCLTVGTQGRATSLLISKHTSNIKPLTICLLFSIRWAPIIPRKEPKPSWNERKLLLEHLFNSTWFDRAVIARAGEIYQVLNISNTLLESLSVCSERYQILTIITKEQNTKHNNNRQFIFQCNQPVLWLVNFIICTTCPDNPL